MDSNGVSVVGGVASTPSVRGVNRNFEVDVRPDLVLNGGLVEEREAFTILFV
jgi:hypothetical protein